MAVRGGRLGGKHAEIADIERQCGVPLPDSYKRLLRCARGFWLLGGSIQFGSQHPFFHDFPPGSYKFKVQPYGTPTGESDRLQLAAGMQTYLQVQAVPNWEQGSTAGGWSCCGSRRWPCSL